MMVHTVATNTWNHFLTLRVICFLGGRSEITPLVNFFLLLFFASLFGAIQEQPRFYLHQPNHQTTNNQQSINNILPAPSILLNQSSWCSHCPPSLHLLRNFVSKNPNVPSAWNPAPTRSSTQNAITASVANALRRAYASAITNAQPAGFLFQHIEHVAGIRNLITL